MSEGFTRNQISKLSSKIFDFCEKHVSRLDGREDFTQSVIQGNNGGAKNGPMYSYLDMVSDGSMALLRAITGSLEKNYNYNILEGANDVGDDVIKDEEVEYYHLVVCSESTVTQLENS